MLATLLPERAYRWNYTVMGLEMSLFGLGISFASVYGVMPLFVHHLTASNLALGLIAAVRSTGFMLPPILVAGYVERLHRKKPLLLWATIVERLPYPLLAVATPLLALGHHTTLLWLFFALLALSSLFGGIATTAWLDMLSRMIPADWRGRFFGLASALGGLLGIAGAAIAAELLHRFTWMTGFALCFGCTSVCLAASFAVLTLGREPEAPPRPPSPHVSLAAYLRRLPGVVRGDRNFGFYMGATMLLTLAGMATSFYTVDAKRTFGLSDAGAGVYAVALLASSTAGNVLWGYVGYHRGHKRVVEGGALCTALAALIALLARDPHWGIIAYGAAFVLVGLASSGVQLAALTFVLDFAPPAQRPTYIGLANIAQAPFGFGAPLIGGAIADRSCYGAVFALSVLLALASCAVLVRYVADPRMAAAAARAL